MSDTIKELLFFKKKYLLVEGLVVLMIFMVMFLSGLTNGLRRFVSAGIENMPAKQFILSDEAEGIIPFSHLTDEQVKAIKQSASIGLEELAIQRSQVTTLDDEKLDVTYFVLEDNSAFAPKLIDGKSVSSDNDIVLDERFKADGIKLGDTITDKNGQTEFKVVGFTSGAMYGHTGIGYISQDSYTQLMSATDPTYRWSPQAFVTTEDTSKIDIAGTDVWNKQDLIEKIPGYSAEQSTLQMITWVLVLASAAILAVFFYIISLDKRQQFGVLKALGMGMGQLAFQQLFQVFFLALVGVVIGDLLTLGLASILPVKMPFFLNITDMASLSIVFILVTVLASLLSVSRIAKIDPIAIINGGES